MQHDIKKYQIYADVCKIKHKRIPTSTLKKILLKEITFCGALKKKPRFFSRCKFKRQLRAAQSGNNDARIPDTPTRAPHVNNTPFLSLSVRFSFLCNVFFSFPIKVSACGAHPSNIIHTLYLRKDIEFHISCATCNTL